MPIIMYGHSMSPPFRAVALAAKAVGVEIEPKKLDMYVKQEHKEEWFLKINPTHTIPTMDDNGFYLWESRAIMGYLIQQYGKDDKLYPKEPKKRALVDNMLYFDAASFFPSIMQYFFPIVQDGTPEDPKLKAAVAERLGFLNTILKDRKYTAGDQLTIADFSIICSLAVTEASGFNTDDFPNVKKWSQRIQAEVPFFDEVTKEGINQMNAFFESKFKK